MEFKFKRLDDYHQIAKVHGGWLVKAIENVAHMQANYRPDITGFDYRVAMAFVPDPTYEWEPTVKVLEVEEC